MTCAQTDEHLDHELMRLARAEAEIDRQLGIRLAALWDRDLFRPLGYVRATNFVREHLGIQESRARWLARLGRHLRAAPDLNRALAAGRIGASQAIELGRILECESSAEVRQAWIEHGARLSVCDLKRVAQATNEPRTEPLAMDPDDPPDGGWITIAAPARVEALWKGAVESARMASGRHISQGQAGEFVFAEYLSAFGTDDTPPMASSEWIESETRVATIIERSESKEAPVIEVTKKAPEDDVPAEDPWELAAVLIHLARDKQRLRYELAGLLRRFSEQRCAGTLGYPGFGAYCNERLGFGIRRAQRLIRFRNGLDRFPKLTAACLAGDISYTAALLLLPILDRTTEAAWVTWAKGLTYREIERVTEQVRDFAPATPADATAFPIEDGTEIPFGFALPPEGNGPPRISGIPADLALTDPERCVAKIRFWMPADALHLARCALDRCRDLLNKPQAPDWVVFELILVHFMQTLDTPAARKIARDHPIIARDDYRCLVHGCTSRANLHSHHFWLRSRRGSNDDWNQGGACAGHHGPGVHAGILEIGGFAPDLVVTRLGINPRTGRAFVAYRNERRISDEGAVAFLAEWRQWWRDRLDRRHDPTHIPRKENQTLPGADAFSIPALV